MTDTQRKYLLAIAAEAVANPAVGATISARGWRRIWIAIDETIGRPVEPRIVVDELLDQMNVRWIPNTPAKETPR